VKDAEGSVVPALAQGIERRCLRPADGDTPAAAYCWNALNTLGAFKAAADSAVPVVVEVLESQPPGSTLHTAAITAAGNIGPAAEGAVPFMIAGLRHSDSYVKQESIRGLERIGPGAHSAIPALEELRRLPDLEAHHRAGIDKALASIRAASADRHHQHD
jgi:HEAT repeat protein